MNILSSDKHPPHVLPCFIGVRVSGSLWLAFWNHLWSFTRLLYPVCLSSTSQGMQGLTGPTQPGRKTLENLGKLDDLLSHAAFAQANSRKI
jgi:hypothetical protein